MGIQHAQDVVAHRGQSAQHDESHLFKAVAEVSEASHSRDVKRAVLVVSDGLVGLVKGGKISTGDPGTLLLKNDASEVKIVLQDADHPHFVAYVTSNPLLRFSHLHVLATKDATNRDTAASLLETVAVLDVRCPFSDRKLCGRGMLS